MSAALLGGPVGIWSRQLRFGDPGESREAAAELEELGYGALWIPGGDGGDDFLESVIATLAETRSVVVATGILNVWMHDPAEVAHLHARLDADHPGRFVLGLGVGHAPIIDAKPGYRYQRPLETMREYLDALDASAPEGTAPKRVIAALAPKMIALAAARTAGAHPYLVPVEHTREARAALPSGHVLAPAQAVILEEDPSRARAIARHDLELYWAFPNYVNTWRRLGWGEDELAAGGSDRLIDALYAWGSPDRIAERVAEHRAAGADHVCLRVITDAPDDSERLPRAEWRALGSVLLP